MAESGLEFEHRMSDADALMWRIEKDPRLRSTIGVVSILDSPPDWDRLVAKTEYGLSVIPRLTQRVVPVPFNLAPPEWVPDPNFELSYHLRRVGAPGKGELADVLAAAEPWIAAGFDRARPLWEFTLVENLEGGRAAIVQKIHHALTDGVGGVAMAMILLDFDRDGGTPAVSDPPIAGEDPSLSDLIQDAVSHNLRRVSGMARRLLPSLAALVRAPDETLRQLGTYAASTARLLAPARSGLSPLFTERSMRRHLRVLTADLETLKAAGKAAGGTLNDAFVAGVAGGLGLYHDAKGSPVAELRMGMPVSLRTEASASVMGNQFAPTRLLIPTGGDAADRISIIGERVKDARGEPALEIVPAVTGLVNALPTAAAVRIFGPMARTIDVTTSNVPGAPVPLFTAGAMLDASYPFGPTAGAALNVTLLSYRGTLDIGINADAAAVDDPELLVACLDEGLRDVQKLNG